MNLKRLKTKWDNKKDYKEDSVKIMIGAGSFHVSISRHIMLQPARLWMQFKQTIQYIKNIMTPSILLHLSSRVTTDNSAKNLMNKMTSKCTYP